MGEPPQRVRSCLTATHQSRRPLMHRNAPLTLEGRLRLCGRIEARWIVLAAEESMTVSRQCAHRVVAPSQGERRRGSTNPWAWSMLKLLRCFEGRIAGSNTSAAGFVFVRRWRTPWATGTADDLANKLAPAVQA